MDQGVILIIDSVQSLSHIWFFVTPMDWNMPGFPVHHQLPDLARIYVHRVSDPIQPSHPLLIKFFFIINKYIS